MRTEKHHVGDAPKQPGKTIAESLGIEVDPKAPGGQKIVPAVHTQRSKRSFHDGEYDGFVDIDGYNRSIETD